MYISRERDGGSPSFLSARAPKLFAPALQTSDPPGFDSAIAPGAGGGANVHVPPPLLALVRPLVHLGRRRAACDAQYLHGEWPARFLCPYGVRVRRHSPNVSIRRVRGGGTLVEGFALSPLAGLSFLPLCTSRVADSPPAPNSWHRGAKRASKVLPERPSWRAPTALARRVTRAGGRGRPPQLLPGRVAFLKKSPAVLTNTPLYTLTWHRVPEHASNCLREGSYPGKMHA